MKDTALVDRLRGTEEEAVLMAVADDGGQSSPSVVDAVTGGRRDTVRVVSLLQELDAVEREQSMAYEVTLTGKGRRLAEQIRTSRTNGRARSEAVGLELLRWLRAQPERPGTADLFADDEAATAYGVPFTVEEVRHAVDYLREHSLIVGTGTMQGPFLRPGLTPEGRAAVESGEAISDYVRGGRGSAQVTNTANFHGGNVAGVQVGGQGNAMRVVQNVTNQERTQIIAGVADVRRALSEAGIVSHDLDAALDAVHEEAAKPNASRPTLREHLTQAVAVAAATEGASLAVQGIAALLNVVPM